MNFTRKFQKYPVLTGGLLAVTLQIFSVQATDLATEPLITPGTSSVKPNMYFILDNSGSMDWDFLPDWVARFDSSSSSTDYMSYCKGSSGKAYDIEQGPTGSNAIHCCVDSSNGYESDQCLASGGRGMPPFYSADFNSVYYNPAITYTTPKNYDGSNKTTYSGSGSVKWDGYEIQSTSSNTITTSFPDVEWCTSTAYTDCLRNDNYLLPGTVSGKSYTTYHATTASGSKSVAAGTSSAPTTSSRTLGPFFYTMVPGEYCTTKKLTDCAAQTAPSTSRPYPAKLRWCNNSSLTATDDTSTTSITEACQALKNSTYKYPRYPTIVLSGSYAAAWGRVTINATPSSGTVTLASFIINNGQASQINLFGGTSLSWAVSTSSAPCGSTDTNKRKSKLAKAIVDKINATASAIAAGFSAALDENSCSNIGRFKITAPNGTTYNAASVTVDGDLLGSSATTVATSTTMSRTTNFASGTDAVVVPGSWARTDIASGGSFGNVVVSGATIIDRSNRSDCAAKPTCTYAEELQNFATWFAWYRTRMQMIKSSVSLAFQGIDDQYRLGYFTLNSASTNLVNIGDFGTSQKQSWYSMLFAADPGSGTPLREALSRAGRMFAGETTSALTGATDPVQYSCQKNYTILSTDGYWNGNAGKQLGGSTDISNHDGSLTRPELDGRNDSGTLADVAAYYYNTDLRATNCTGALGGDVCADNVPTTTTDLKQTQHMVTFTIGLGIDGVMQYRSNYKQTAGSGDTPDDYTAVAAGTAPSPTTGVCSWQTSGNCNWPQPGSDKQENIDDLWHAAVNGHGTYYSARNPTELYSGLTDALSTINASTGGAAAATTSNPNITTGDNFVFSSNYMTVEWTGELVSQNIDVTTGDILPTINWSAQAQVDATTPASRTIKTFDATAGSKLKSFEWANLNGLATSNTCNPPADEKGCFSSTYIDANLSQFCASGTTCLSSGNKTSAAGENLLLFLRGDHTHETDSPPWYRPRTHLLGDVVSAEAVYAGRYLYDYGGTYPERNTARSNPTVYMASNDGMLHALNSTTGGERWAYIPSMALPKLHRLANINYDTNHTFILDGTPVVADINASGWKTILVGGLAGGGAGYYALDISDQTAPTAKWEFRKKSGCTSGSPTGAGRYSSSGGVTEDCDLGYSYGNPVIGKLGGTWVVLVTSGYNNHTNGGTGIGYLYILNADTGAVISKISTAVGDTVTPSGLSRINAWSDDAMTDNTITYAYGGDLLGNLWKFDLTAGSKILLKNFGVTKPITAKPELGEVTTSTGEAKRVVFVPTGRLLGLTDLGVTDTQSFYAIWDATSTPSNIVSTTINSGGTGRTGTTCNSVFDDPNNLGWKIDFPSSGERGNTDPTLAFGTLVFSTNRPSAADACNPSGFESWVYNIDYKCGGVVEKAGDTNTHIATHYSGASTRPNVVVLPSGVVKSITRTSGQQLSNNVEEVRIGSTANAGRRVSWRELLD